jgi:hypothetical protein
MVRRPGAQIENCEKFDGRKRQDNSIPEDESDTTPLLFGTVGADPVKDNPQRAARDGMPFGGLLRPNKRVEA